MITEQNYSKTTIQELTKCLPRGARQKIAKKLNKSYPQVDNTWSGKHYDKSIVNEIVKMYNRTIAKQVAE